MGLSTVSGAVVAVIGSGGRETCLAWKLAQSPVVRAVSLVPGNAYTGSRSIDKVSNGDFTLDVQDPASFNEFTKWCKHNEVNLVVVGPEAPLAAGIVDYLNDAGIECFGPTQAAAELEWNKEFAKKCFDRAKIPTARWKAFTDPHQAEEFINTAPFDALVIKANGLAAGKGVVVAGTKEEACNDVRAFLDGHRFGSAGSTIVVEEKLVGPEVSILCFTDGKDVFPMPAAQDAKRVGEGDSGSNTGGMGAYAPVHPSILSEEIFDEIIEYVRIVVKLMAEEGRPYKGILYAGVMLTEGGPRFLEFNCRFGDPETEVLIPLLETDLYPLLLSCVHGNLPSQHIKFSSSQATVCVVAASRGYPETAEKGTTVNLKKDTKNCVFDQGTYIFPAALGRSGANYVTAGGRVLMAVGQAETLLQASILAQRCLDLVAFDGQVRRRDIGYQSIIRSVSAEDSLTYKKCSVDIEEGDRLIDEFIITQAKATSRTGLLHGVGGFGGMFDLTKLDYKEPILVSGTDGVGTKLLIAEETGTHEHIGIDLVAMSVNDILTHNAEPIFFLDYFATGKLSADTAGVVIRGIVEGCKQSNCVLIGGETAEMPGMYPAGRYDLAGFAVGVVEKSQILPRPESVQSGDVVIGIGSSGIHSNGYSLVRQVVAQSGCLYTDAAPFDAKKSLGDALLESTKIYTRSLLPVLRSDLLKSVRGVAHITGGGLTENIPRILPKAMDVVLNAQQWPMHPVFSWLSVEGHVAPLEMARTFNLGLGMVIIVSAATADALIQKLGENGEPSWKIGEVVEGSQKVHIDGLESAMISSYMAWATIRTTSVSPKKRRVGILISGTGSNMEALVAFTKNPLNKSLAEVVVVVSNKGDAGGIGKAQKMGIAIEVIDHKKFSTREEYDAAMNNTLDEHRVEVVCLAGYMRICTSVFVHKWRGRCINTHPALLPSFKGKDGIQMALDAKVRVTGCTVHFVEEEVDAGGIILQAAVAVYPEDTRENLADRIKAVEHQLFPRAMEAVVRGDAVRGDDGLVQWNNFHSYAKL